MSSSEKGHHRHVDQRNPGNEAAELYLETLGIPSNLPPSMSFSFGGAAVVPQGATLSRAEIEAAKWDTTPTVTFAPAVHSAHKHHTAPAHAIDSGAFTLVFFDVDAPAPHADGRRHGRLAPWLHWLVTDCHDGTTTSGKTVVEYQGPSPPTGVHRYIAVLFQQKTADVQLGSRKRESWDFEDFISRNAANLIPVGVTYFNVCGDDCE